MNPRPTSFAAMKSPLGQNGSLVITRFLRKVNENERDSSSPVVSHKIRGSGHEYFSFRRKKNFSTPARGFACSRNITLPFSSLSEVKQFTSSYPNKNNPLTGVVFVFVGREGFEPPKAEADRFTVCCNRPLYHLPILTFTKYLPKHPSKLLSFLQSEPSVGLEPTTHGLQNRCSTN